MKVSYIVENRYGNYVPTLASLAPREDDYILVPEASAMACIKLEDAQRFIVEHADTVDGAFSDPIKPAPSGITLLSTLLAAQH